MHTYAAPRSSRMRPSRRVRYTHSYVHRTCRGRGGESRGSAASFRQRRRSGGRRARAFQCLGGLRGGNEARPGGRLVRGLCRCSWPAGPAWAATARLAVRLGRRPDGCAPRRKKLARTRSVQWRQSWAGGREASARTFICIILLLLSSPPSNTHTRILLLLYEAADAHTYIHIIPILLLGVCRAFARGGASTITVGCVFVWGERVVLGGGSGGNTSSLAHTRTRGARADRIYSRARRFPSFPSAKPFPSQHSLSTIYTHTHSGIARQRRRRPSHPPDSRRSRPSDLTRRGPRRRFFSSSPRHPSYGGPKSRVAFFPARFSFPFRPSPYIHAADDARIHIACGRRHAVCGRIRKNNIARRRC